MTGALKKLFEHLNPYFDKEVRIIKKSGKEHKTTFKGIYAKIDFPNWAALISVLNAGARIGEYSLIFVNRKNKLRFDLYYPPQIIEPASDDKLEILQDLQIYLVNQKARALAIDKITIYETDATWWCA